MRDGAKTSRKRSSPKEAIGILREADVRLSPDKSGGTALSGDGDHRVERSLLAQGVRGDEDRPGQAAPGTGVRKRPLEAADAAGSLPAA